MKCDVFALLPSVADFDHIFNRLRLKKLNKRLQIKENLNLIPDNFAGAGRFLTAPASWYPHVIDGCAVVAAVSYLLHNHVDYAVELGLAGIPLPETRNHPEIYFFDIVRQGNTIIFLVDKLFSGKALCQICVILSARATSSSSSWTNSSQVKHYARFV